MIDNCKKFIELIKKEKFYDAHEILEEIWFPKRKEKSSEILIIKGFINASVALELKRLKKDSNAKKVWNNYLKYKPLIKKCDIKIFKEIENLLDSCYEKYLS
ncbi:DUF309 domain-containing protein [Nitrosophilus kaiyonis]|uniref:DUF309 domain-containing protein n=1 Tax=Nitrosophilus kaiyonis TaxID=2930200 RepID=UPI002492F3DD|nr:DUF309 domain-containing protein [Nitrosophilus kaiyonis]